MKTLFILLSFASCTLAARYHSPAWTIGNYRTGFGTLPVRVDFDIYDDVVAGYGRIQDLRVTILTINRTVLAQETLKLDASTLRTFGGRRHTFDIRTPYGDIILDTTTRFLGGTDPAGRPTPTHVEFEIDTDDLELFDHQWISDAILRPDGDFNDDGNSDFRDFLMISQNYGKRGSYSEGDLNRDGFVTDEDVDAFVSGYGAFSTNLVSDQFCTSTGSPITNGTYQVNQSVPIVVTSRDLEPVETNISFSATFQVSNAGEFVILDDIDFEFPTVEFGGRKIRFESTDLERRSRSTPLGEPVETTIRGSKCEIGFGTGRNFWFVDEFDVYLDDDTRPNGLPKVAGAEFLLYEVNGEPMLQPNDEFAAVARFSHIVRSSRNEDGSRPAPITISTMPFGRRVSITRLEAQVPEPSSHWPLCFTVVLLLSIARERAR